MLQRIGRSGFVAAAAIAIVATDGIVAAQEGGGPFVPHRGQQITTHFTNDLGRDADSTTIVEAVTRDLVAVSYSSTRGISVRREITMADRDNAPAYVLGYAPGMPEIIPGTTSLGISAAVLSQLRSQGSAPLTLIHSARLERIECTLTAEAVDVRAPMIVEDRVFDLPAIVARADCGSGNRTGTGRLTFANDVNNPILIESVLKFSWEARPRTERVTRVIASSRLHRDMQQSLDTLGTYDVYGLLFDFDSTALRPEVADLVRDIAAMLNENPRWVIQIAGHTDAVGAADYNLRLSAGRAESVLRGLVASGVEEGRLRAVGYGAERPRADNATLGGRAINRRVEFRRLDR